MFDENGVPKVNMTTMVEYIRAQVSLKLGIGLSEEAVLAVLEAENAFIFHEKGVDGGE